MSFIRDPLKKPERWGVVPGLTDSPGLWRNIEVAMPMWEGGGATYDLVTRQGIPLSTGFSWLAGAHGRGLDYDGTGAGLVIPNTATIADSGPFSVVCVIDNSANSSASSVILGKGAGAHKGWALKTEQFNATGKIGFTKFGVVDSTSSIDSPVGFSIIGVTVESDDNPVVYLNGVADDLANATAIITSSRDFRIGTTTTGGDDYIGEIYAVYIWSRALAFCEQVALARDPFGMIRQRERPVARVPAAVAGRIMSSLVGGGGLVHHGGLAGQGGGLAG